MTKRTKAIDRKLNLAAKSFAENGVGVLRGAVSPTEIQDLVKESERLWAEQEQLVPQNVRVGLRKDPSGATTLERLDPVADISALFASINIDDRMVSIARASLNEPSVVLKEKLIYKWPGTSGYGAHRDEPYFGTSGVPGNEMISVSLALDATTLKNGAVKFYPALRNALLESPEGEPRDLLSESLPSNMLFQPELAPGDIVFFDGLVPHCSDYNRSSSCRRIYTITYAPARYPSCREKYYASRLVEMESERRIDFPGPYFLR